ncbi:MAG TPA: DnaJ domain-containing protein [Roseiflexaceae bacterium]|nr:DnaJ domain-containing protein [Roseiflexaceae bacterium]
MSQDLYEILQVHPRADGEAIRAAYQRLIALYDPARLEGAADELVALARQKRDAIEHAYAVLSDAERRRSYDAEQTTTQANRGGRAAPIDEADEADDEGDEGEPALDYRPLPPSRRAERPKGFSAEPVRSATARRAAESDPRAWQVPAIIAAVLIALIAPVSLLVTQFGNTPAAPAAGAAPTPTASAVDQFEPFLADARSRAEQSPNNVQGWIDYGNLLFDSAIIAREQDATGALYQQRLPRWLEATDAYSRALALDPNNAPVRADMGASLCFYGAGVNDQAVVVRGLNEVRSAAGIAPDDLRVLLNLGNCLVTVQPPRTDEAIKSWRRIIELAPNNQQAAEQARLLIARYEQQ